MLGCKLVCPDGSLDKAASAASQPTELAVPLRRDDPARSRSPRFAQYTAGHIAEDQTALVDAVNGAFMLVRREALDAVGLLDVGYWL
ncbi:MAG: hypothetical protein WKF43_00280 [Acidimicrobiales bacterium]